MKAPLNLLCLLFSFSLISDVECLANQPLQKRLPPGTTLYDLTRSNSARNEYQIVIKLSGDEVTKGEYISWGSEPRTLSMLTNGDLGIAIESNFGAWLCVLDVSGLKGFTNIRVTVWTPRCRDSLDEALNEWQEAADKQYEQNNPAAKVNMKLLAGQIFALAIQGGTDKKTKERKPDKPMGLAWRPQLVNFFFRLLQSDNRRSSEMDRFDLLGWSVFKVQRRPTAETLNEPSFGLAITQEKFDRVETENTASSVIQIYATGYGEESSTRPITRGNQYGQFPALGIAPTGGFEVPCSDNWGFMNDMVASQYSDRLDDAFVADPRHPTS